MRDAAHKRQTELLRRVAAGGAHLVLDFLRGSERRLDAVDQILACESLSAAERLAARPFGECGQPLRESVQAWAVTLGKSVSFEVTGRETLVEPQLAAILGGALAHFARNAVAHGIETSELRTQRGKPSFGVLRIACQRKDRAALEITIEDDGQGIRAQGLSVRPVGATAGSTP